MKYRIALLLAGVGAASSSGATVFCVASADDLTAALAAAQLDTTASAEIRIHRGSYMAPAGGWHIDINVRGITVAGGYDDGCASASADATLTVLDGGFSTRPLTIDTSFAVQPNPTTHDITVRGLTFARGLGDRVGGLKISDAGPITTGSILVEGNIFRNNSATVHQQDNSAGALLAATDGADGSGNVFLIVRGNLFVGNEAPDGAAAMLFSNNAIDVSNNTVTRNQSFEPSLAIRSAFASFTFSGINYSNNIFWENNPDALADTFDLRADNPFGSSHAADLFANDLQAVHGTPRTDLGNLAVDPLFADVLQGDFRLASASPLINAGLDTPNGGLTAVDLAGAARVQGSHVDVGAYESAPQLIFQNGFE
jgi:hypothetical protein